MKNKDQLVSYEELLTTQMLQREAIARILEKKGITTQDEILEEVKALKVEMDEKIKKMGRVN